jgi:hypothetical protein
MKILQIILFLSLATYVGMSQDDSTKYVEYTPDYKYTDGIFLSFDQVKKNQPVSIDKIITKEDYNDATFFKNLVKEEVIAVFDNNGMRKEIKPGDVWGYAKMGVLYINYNDEFNRIPVVGSIAHFVSNYTIENSRAPDYAYNPYYYNDPYRHLNNRTYATKEMRQYLIDWESGDVYYYEWKSLKVLLMRDPELYEEYNNLKKRKQKKLVFFYLRRFNERNPLMVPLL